MAEQRVVCPKCGHRFPISKALTDQIEHSLRHQFDEQSKEQVRAAKATFAKRLLSERERVERQVTANFRKRLAAEKSRVRREAVKEAQASAAAHVAGLRKHIRQSELAVKGFQKREAAVKARDKLLKAKEQDIDKAIAREVEVARKKTLLEATERIEREHHTRDLQHQKVVADLRKQLIEAKRRLDQSSEQSQGEVIELELERTLASVFPDDKIRPIAKGKLGADIIHKIISPNGAHCGTIVWETKNTKNWSKSWLTKLRADQRREKAEIAVLVSTVLPRGMPSHLGQISGVWVTDFTVAAGLAIALRANLIELSRFRTTSQASTEKMQLLYHYLMSIEFKQRVEAIVEGFSAMKDDLDKEKQVTERNWVKREKHLDLVLQNVSGMVGDMQAIAPAFPRIKRLELPEPSG